MREDRIGLCWFWEAWRVRFRETEEQADRPGLWREGERSVGGSWPVVMYCRAACTRWWSTVKGWNLRGCKTNYWDDFKPLAERHMSFMSLHFGLIFIQRCHPNTMAIFNPAESVIHLPYELSPCRPTKTLSPSRSPTKSASHSALHPSAGHQPKAKMRPSTRMPSPRPIMLNGEMRCGGPKRSSK